MKVGELIKLLQAFDPDDEAIVCYETHAASGIAGVEGDTQGFGYRSGDHVRRWHKNLADAQHEHADDTADHAEAIARDHYDPGEIGPPARLVAIRTLR